MLVHNPKTYLPLAPKFYKLLTTSSSNWMTIKLVKVFGALTPLEPRLGKKLVGPLSEILETTTAKSLLYECIRTVVAGMTSQEKIVRQAVDKLKDMLEGTRVFEPPSGAEEALAKISLAFACQVLRPALDVKIDVDSGMDMATAHPPSEEREGRHPPRRRSRGGHDKSRLRFQSPKSG